MVGGSFLKFEDGPMAAYPPVINTGPWPPSERIAAQIIPGGQALVKHLEPGPLPPLPPKAMVYKRIRISEIEPGHPNVWPGAVYVLETEAEIPPPPRPSADEVR